MAETRELRSEVLVELSDKYPKLPAGYRSYVHKLTPTPCAACSTSCVRRPQRPKSPLLLVSGKDPTGDVAHVIALAAFHAARIRARQASSPASLGNEPVARMERSAMRAGVATGLNPGFRAIARRRRA